MAFDRSLANPNIHISTHKSKILWPHPSPPPPELVEQCRSRNLELALESAENIGVLFGSNHDATIEYNNKKVRSYQKLYDALTDPQMPPQVATGILRDCASAKLTYRARTANPRSMAEAAKIFDTDRTRVYNQINRLQTTPDSTTSDFLFDTALGFRLAQYYIVPAFYAAATVAAHSDPTLFQHEPHNMNPYIQHFQDSWSFLVQQGLQTADELPLDDGEYTLHSLSTLPADFTKIPTFYHPALNAEDPCKIQRALSKALASMRQDHHTLSNADDATCARLNSLLTRGALAWFRCPPTSPETTFQPDELREAIKFINDIPP